MDLARKGVLSELLYADELVLMNKTPPPMDLARKGVLSELLYADELVLMNKTINGLGKEGRVK